MQTVGLIMAGGGGTRFWPLSRERTPKQLLQLDGKDYMVCEAVRRIAPLTGGNTFVITNALQAEKMREVCRGLVDSEKILVEPSARNTAPCIGYAALKVIEKYGDAVMVITPSDAYIADDAEFCRALSLAVAEAEAGDALLTVGIEPTFPATGYGYIRTGEKVGKGYAVSAFVEKPSAERAKAYLDSGEYLWNSGMFVWKASVILERIRLFLPALYEGLLGLRSAMREGREQEGLREIYPTLPSVSVDYGVMEKSQDIIVVRGNFGWNDVGSFDRLGVLHGEDEQGNVAVGDVLLQDTENAVVYSSGRTVAVVGMQDVVVVETPDCVMVCRRSGAQDVKKIVDLLKKQGRKELL